MSGVSTVDAVHLCTACALRRSTVWLRRVCVGFSARLLFSLLSTVFHLFEKGKTSTQNAAACVSVSRASVSTIIVVDATLEFGC